MAELVAVQSGLALFRAGGTGVVIDTEDLNPFDPRPVDAILASGTWDSSLAAKSGVQSVCYELADAALEDFSPDVAVTASAHATRTVRVPKRVKDAVRSGLEAVRNDETIAVPLVAAATAEKLAAGTVTIETVGGIHSYFANGGGLSATRFLYGGDAGREWAAKVANEFGLVAASPPPAAPVPVAPAPPPTGDPREETNWTDPNQPHEYVTLSDTDTVCALCGKPEADPIHVPAEAVPAAAPQDDAPPAAASSVTYFGLFTPDGDTGRTFKIQQVLAKDDDGSWWLREMGDWSPTQSPEDGANLVQLDEESFNAAVTQLDEPGTEYAELSVTEEELFRYAESALNYEVLDAVFAAAPYVPTEVRSANAAKQLRDAKGHFILMGGKVQDSDGQRATITGVDKENGTVSIQTDAGVTKTVPANEVAVDKNAANSVAPDASDSAAPEPAVPVARLSQPGVLVSDVNALIEQKKAEWAGTSEPPVTAAADPLMPPDEPPPAAPAPSSSGPSDPTDSTDDTDNAVDSATVTPLYLAEVDPNDTQAVLDLIAVIPSQGPGDEVESYKRTAGSWVAAPDVMQALQGPTPPPVVELQADELTNVMSQVDSGGHTDPAPSPTGSPDDGGTSDEEYALLDVFSVTASGELTMAQVRGAKLLSAYNDVGIPREVEARLNELAAGVDTHPAAAERLRQYWEHGEGGAKIRWGEGGDWQRCVDHLGKYMGERAKGYCTLRHKGATGFYPGHAPTEQEPGKSRHLQVVDDMPTLAEFAGDKKPSDAPATDAPATDAPTVGTPADGLDPTEPHPFAPGHDDLCIICGTGPDDPIHTTTEPPIDGENPDDAPANPDDTGPSTDQPDVPVEGDSPDYSQPHVFVLSLDPEDGPDTCDCGRPKDDPMHVVTAAAFNADTAEEVSAGQKFRIPLVVPEGVPSGDGRTFAPNSLSSRDVPLALMWQPEGDEGHKGSVIVGRIDHVERLADGGLGNAYGVFDTGKYGQEALRLVKAGMLRGISADLDEFDAEVLDDADKKDNRITSTKLMVNKGRLMGVTLVAKPAFAECSIELDNEGVTDMADGEYAEDNGEARVAALIASAAPLHPPKDWFKDPQLGKPTHLTITDDGRVFGHIAAWDVDHIGLPFGTRAPRSASNYAYFRTGLLRTAEGDDVSVGQLTLAGGHASLQADARAAVKHYDDTASAWADVSAGEDAFGIWVSGALRPNVTPEQIRVARASSPSGDWRPIKGKLELVAACCVNVPGFPVARAMVSGGQVMALVAAGTVMLEKPDALSTLDQATVDERIARLEAAETRRLEEQARQLAARLAPAREERHLSLVASAAAIKARVAPVREEKQRVLVARVEELKARVAAGVVPFDENKHPRGHGGKFRAVLAHLHSTVGSTPGAEAGIKKVDQAAGHEDAGDHSAASAAAHEGADAFEAAAKKASGDAKQKLEDAAGQVRQAVEALDPNAETDKAGGGDVMFDELTDEMKALLTEVVDRAEERLDPANPDEAVAKAKAFITGTRAWNPNDIANFVKNQIKRPLKPNASAVLPGSKPQPPSAQPQAPSPV